MFGYFLISFGRARIIYSIPFPLLSNPKVDRTILFSRFNFFLDSSCETNGTLGIPWGMKNNLLSSIS